MNDEFKEGAKLFHDTIKHLSTLSTGSILLLVALLEKLFTAPHWKLVVATSFVSFIISTASSVRVMIAITGLVARGDDDFNRSIPFYKVSAWTFILGIFCLVAFILRNLW